MRGLVLAGARRIEVRDDLPDPAVEAPGDAVVRVHRAGLCGSDLHPWAGREPFLAGVVPGHEAVGEVVATGAAVTTVHVGDRVVVPFSTSCGRCGACRRGLSARCERARLFGWGAPDGSTVLPGTQAELVRVPDADGTLVVLPARFDDDAGVLLADNLPTGWYAAQQTDARADDPVAVLGCGAVGLCTIVALAAVRPGGTIQVVAVPTRSTLELSPVVAYDRNLTVRFGRAPVRSLLPAVLGAVTDGRLRVPTEQIVTGSPLALADGPAAYRRAADPDDDTGKLTFAP